MTVTFGAVLVMARRYPEMDMAPINALAALLCSLACWPMVAAMPTLAELGILALFGVITTALSYLLFLTGGRHIPSSEAGLIALLDVVLGPLWVWLVFAEDPGEAALIGGSLVLAAVVWYLLPSSRKRRSDSHPGGLAITLLPEGEGGARRPKAGGRMRGSAAGRAEPK